MEPTFGTLHDEITELCNDKGGASFLDDTVMSENKGSVRPPGFFTAFVWPSYLIEQWIGETTQILHRLCVAVQSDRIGETIQILHLLCEPV